MNFWTRFGWSLLVFGLVAVVAPMFGYAPRKLQNMSPGQIQAAGVVFMAMGAFAWAIGRDAQVRRRIFIWGGAVTGLALLLLVSAVVYGRFVRQRRLTPPPPPPASSPAFVPPPLAGAPVPPPPGGRSASPLSPVPGSVASEMAVLHERARAWEKERGRERVWSVVVHLSGGEPPEHFEARLREATSGEVVVARVGGLLHARVAPVEDGERLRVALETLFPGARVQLLASGRQVTVFARPAATSR
jgi:hypothetical protein